MNCQTSSNTRRFRWIGRLRQGSFFKPFVVTLTEMVAVMALLPDLPVIGPAVAPRA
jgi:hypothetical protein